MFKCLNVKEVFELIKDFVVLSEYPGLFIIRFLPEPHKPLGIMDAVKEYC
jgi:hypothetical protein